ncbi:Crp/Fnr family transcriptional regulator [Gammaproteobacteria bacterium]|nr:Crp/Fnr family transcriptional regulator [Gammaproteobacteria bacterium]
MASAEQQLTEFFRQLSAADQLTMLAFAEFLAARNSAGNTVISRQPLVIPEPEVIQRPAEESVVAALKRLSKSYPMLDKKEMLSATSDLVATNIMQRTDTAIVVDELEAIFRAHYEKLKPGEHG